MLKQTKLNLCQIYSIQQYCPGPNHSKLPDEIEVAKVEVPVVEETKEEDAESDGKETKEEDAKSDEKEVKEEEKPKKEKSNDKEDKKEGDKK